MSVHFDRPPVIPSSPLVILQERVKKECSTTVQANFERFVKEIGAERVAKFHIVTQEELGLSLAATFPNIHSERMTCAKVMGIFKSLESLPFFAMLTEWEAESYSRLKLRYVTVIYIQDNDFFSPRNNWTSCATPSERFLLEKNSWLKMLPHFITHEDAGTVKEEGLADIIQLLDNQPFRTKIGDGTICTDGHMWPLRLVEPTPPPPISLASEPTPSPAVSVAPTAAAEPKKPVPVQAVAIKADKVRKRCCCFGS